MQANAVTTLGPTGPAAGLSADQIASFEGADLVVLLPTLNEEEGLAKTLADIPFDRLRASGWTVRPLVIDGPSTDRTREVAAAHGVPVLVQGGKGKGAAIREALGWLADRHTRLAVVLDADSTYPGSMIPAVAQLLDAGSDLVVGIRQPIASIRDDPREFVHRVGNRVLNIAAAQVSGLPILDLCSGFWGVRVAAVPPLKLETDGFEIEAELFTKSYCAGYYVTQIPVSYGTRVGVAKLRAMQDGIRILLTTIRFGRRPILSGPNPMKSPAALRELLCVAILTGTQDFVLLVDEGRMREAEGMAQRLRQARPGCSVTLRPAAWPRPPVALTELPGVTITLPPKSDPASPFAVVELPETRRLVALYPNRERPGDLGGIYRSGATHELPAELRLEYGGARGGPSNRLRAVAQHTWPTAEAKELAFLGANGHYGRIAVWRYEAPEGSSPTTPVVSPASGPEPSAPGTPVGLSDKNLR